MAISLTWLQAKGVPYSGYPDLNYCYQQYLASKSGLTNTDLSTHLRTILNNLGYTNPSLQQALRDFYSAKTGIAITTDFATLENAFFASNANDYV